MPPDEPPDVLFTALVRAERPRMLRWAQRRCPRAAEDCVQEACLKAWRYWPPPHAQHLHGWLWRLLQQQVAGWYRREQRHRRLAQRLPRDTMTPSCARRAEVQSSLEALPVELHAALWLVAVLGLTHQEVAATTGGNINTSMTRVFRARHRLMP